MLIAVTLCDSSDWLDHRQLLDYGFSLYSPTLISEKGVLRFTLADGSHAVNGEEISCLLPEGAGSAEIYTEIFKEYAEPSDIIGKVHIKYGGKAIKDVPLIKTE